MKKISFVKDITYHILLSNKDYEKYIKQFGCINNFVDAAFGDKHNIVLIEEGKFKQDFRKNYIRFHKRLKNKLK